VERTHPSQKVRDRRRWKSVEDSACNTGDCGSMPTVLSYIKSHGSLGPDRDNTFEQGDEWMESVMNFWETEIWINMESQKEKCPITLPKVTYILVWEPHSDIEIR
jgi:hypothetical protein